MHEDPLRQLAGGRRRRARARALSRHRLHPRAGRPNEQGRDARSGVCETVDAVINYSPTADVAARADAFPKARIAVRSGVGFDNLDLGGWGARGVPVCNVPDYGTTEVADHAIGADAGADARHVHLCGRDLSADGAEGWHFSRAPLIAPPQGRDLRHRRARPDRAGRGAPGRRLRHEGGLLRSVSSVRRRSLDRLRAGPFAGRADGDERRGQHPRAASSDETRSCSARRPSPRRSPASSSSTRRAGRSSISTRWKRRCARA